MTVYWYSFAWHTRGPGK